MWCTLYQEILNLSKAASLRLRQQPAETSTWYDLLHQDSSEGLTRERIVAAAISIADDLGLAAVSIRKLAAQLNSSPMALYHYVPTKRDLLNLMLDATYEEFEWSSKTIRSWREALSQFAWESRRCLKRHPWVNVLRSDNPEYGPECIRTLEAVLASLTGFGLDMRTAIRVLGTVFIFVNGFVAVETENKSKSQRRKPQHSGTYPLSFSRAVLATGKFPNVERFIEMEAESPDDEGFDRALQWILNGMSSTIESLSSNTARSKPAALTFKKRVR